jgi:adenosine deaminase
MPSLPELIEKGQFVAPGSDDPDYVGGSLNENDRAVAEAFPLPRQTLWNLARNGLEAALLDEAGKAAYLARINSYKAVARA